MRQLQDLVLVIIRKKSGNNAQVKLAIVR